MGFIEKIKFRFRRGLGILDLQESSDKNYQYLKTQIETLSDQLNTLNHSLAILSQPERVIDQLNALTGKYYLALDYAPSCHYEGRWGYNYPPHTELTELFETNLEAYRQIIQRLIDLKPYLWAISQNFELSNFPQPGWLGGAINAIDSALLYYFIVQYCPKKYVEIGSGISTLFATRAKNDHQLETEIISIDPQPRIDINSVCDQVICSPLEKTDLSLFSQLEAGDIVFVDGSHRSFMNSDVTVFMLDILPKLKSGVIIHFHDVVLPYDYDKIFWDWHWNEQYILAAYLLGARQNINILMPSRFVSLTSEFQQQMTSFLEGWNAPRESWLSGGSLWFTHR